MPIEAITALAPGLLLHLVRAAAFFVAQPIFGVQDDSRLLRIVLALALGLILFWTGGRPVVAVGSLLELAALAIREALIGLALGFATRMLTSALITAGEILAQEMGFSMAQIVNPATGASSAVVSQLYEAMAFLLIFQLDLHHEVIRILAWVQQVVPVGQGFDVAALHQGLAALVGDSLHAAMRFSVPVLGVMLVLTTAMVVLGRAVPTIHLMEFGYGLRVLVALLGAVWFLGSGAGFLEAMWADMLERTRHLLTPI